MKKNPNKWHGIFEGIKAREDGRGYPYVLLKGKRLRIHRLLWERVHGCRPEGYDLHHKDLNRINYSVDNLELVTKLDHRRIHAGWIRKNGEWVAKPCSSCKQMLSLVNFYSPSNEYDNICKNCRSIKAKERFKNPLAKAMARESHKRCYWAKRHKDNQAAL